MIKYFKAEVDFVGRELYMAVCVESKFPDLITGLVQEKIQRVAEDLFNIGGLSRHALNVSKVTKTTKKRAESGDRFKSYTTAWLM